MRHCADKGQFHCLCKFMGRIEFLPKTEKSVSLRPKPPGAGFATHTPNVSAPQIKFWISSRCHIINYFYTINIIITHQMGISVWTGDIYIKLNKRKGCRAAISLSSLLYIILHNWNASFKRANWSFQSLRIQKSKYLSLFSLINL